MGREDTVLGERHERERMLECFIDADCPVDMKGELD